MRTVPDLSLVVCTFNRCELLRRTLDGLFAQETGSTSIEIIVADNNSSDGTRELVRELARRSRVRLRYVFEARQGASYARNAGFAEARGSIIAFIDDDLDAPPDWVARIVRFFDGHPEISCLGGKVLPLWSAPPPAWLTREHWSPMGLMDFGDEPRELDPEKPACLMSGNFACRREAFERVGGFDPSFRRSQDEDLTRRLLDAGFRGVLVPEVVVHAPIEVDRMSRDHHRRWHRTHGYFCGQMHAPEVEACRWRLLGIPSHLYRSAALSVLAWGWGTLSGRGEEVFGHELRLHFFRGFFCQRQDERRGVAARRLRAGGPDGRGTPASGGTDPLLPGVREDDLSGVPAGEIDSEEFGSFAGAGR